MERVKLLSIGEAAGLLGVHPQTLRRWVKSGRVPAVTLVSGHLRFEFAVIERLRREMGITTKEAAAEDGDDDVRTAG